MATDNQINLALDVSVEAWRIRNNLLENASGLQSGLISQNIFVADCDLLLIRCGRVLTSDGRPMAANLTAGLSGFSRGWNSIRSDIVEIQGGIDSYIANNDLNQLLIDVPARSVVEIQALLSEYDVASPSKTVSVTDVNDNVINLSAADVIATGNHNLAVHFFRAQVAQSAANSVTHG